MNSSQSTLLPISVGSGQGGNWTRDSIIGIVSLVLAICGLIFEVKYRTASKVCYAVGKWVYSRIRGNASGK